MAVAAPRGKLCVCALQSLSFHRKYCLRVGILWNRHRWPLSSRVISFSYIKAKLRWGFGNTTGERRGSISFLGVCPGLFCSWIAAQSDGCRSQRCSPGARQRPGVLNWLLNSWFENKQTLKIVFLPFHWLQTFSPVLNWTKPKEKISSTEITLLPPLSTVLLLCPQLWVFLFPSSFFNAFFFLLCPFSHHFCSSPLRCSLSSFESLKYQTRLERLGKWKEWSKIKKLWGKEAWDSFLSFGADRAIKAWVKPIWRKQASSAFPCHILSAFLLGKPLVWSYPASDPSPVTPPAIKVLLSLHAHFKLTHWLQRAAFTPSDNVLLLPQGENLFLSNCLCKVFIC